MGNNSTILNNSVLNTTYREKDWIAIPSGFQELWKNIRTGKIAQVYCFSKLDTVEKYEFRKFNNKYLVQIFHAFPPDESRLCLGKQHSHSFVVLVQAIKCRLSDLKRMSEGEALYALNQILRGLHLLSEFYPNIRINERMIFINMEGNIKVWLNENYVLN